MALAVCALERAGGRIVGLETLLASGRVATGFVHGFVVSRIDSLGYDSAGAFLPVAALLIGVRCQCRRSHAEAEGRRERKHGGFGQHSGSPGW